MLLLAGLVSACAAVTVSPSPSADSLPNPTLSVPPDSATPETVLRAYLDAVVAGDCTKAHAFAASTFVFGNGELCGRLQMHSYAINPQPAGNPANDLVFATTIRVTGGDQSMPDGDHTWFYTLKRQPNGAWRLTGGGSAP